MSGTSGIPSKLPPVHVSIISGGCSTHKGFPVMSMEMFLFSRCSLPWIQAASPPTYLFLVLSAKEGKEEKEEPQTRGSFAVFHLDQSLEWLKGPL